MDHGLSIERRVREGLLEIGRKLDIPALATNDCHYVTREAAHNHEALLCVQTGKTLSDPNRFKFDGDGYYLKSAAEMRALWDDEIPGACDSTLLDRRTRAVLRGRVGPARPHAGLPGARRARPGVVAAARGGRRAGTAVPGRRATRVRRTRRLRDRGHLRQGLSVVLPDRRRPRRLRAVGGHPGGSRPRFGRGLAGGLRAAHHRHRPDRARSAVRALPQPRARIDARHRHRLRRPPPRRDGALRRRQVGPATGSPRSSRSAPSKPRRR